MSRTLYSPRLSDDVVRALYREGQRRGMPMTRLADDLHRQALGSIPRAHPALHVCGDEPEVLPLRKAGVAYSVSSSTPSEPKGPAATPGLFVSPNNQPPIPITMAIKFIANYSKRLGLPGYSSHQFSVSVGRSDVERK